MAEMAIFWVTKLEKFEKIEFSKMPLDCQIEPLNGQNRDFCVFYGGNGEFSLQKSDFISFIRKSGDFRHKKHKNRHNSPTKALFSNPMAYLKT